MSLFTLHLSKLREIIGNYIDLQNEHESNGKIDEVSSQLDQGIQHYCKAFDQVIAQAYEEEINDVSIDIEVLDKLVQKYL